MFLRIQLETIEIDIRHWASESSGLCWALGVSIYLDFVSGVWRLKDNINIRRSSKSDPPFYKEGERSDPRKHGTLSFTLPFLHSLS